mmetsp:Transcript_5168/g.8477  ORF Transcript_5168/g.8477 Transcript_5168/m.8477 type:complete len:334 (+) Transcript_5168:126-1127(+)
MLLSPHTLGVIWILYLLPFVLSFRPVSLQTNKILPKNFFSRISLSPSARTPEESRNGNDLLNNEAVLRSVRPTLPDHTRTITHLCKSGTLSTISEKGHPLGTSVDYVLNQKGHPIFFFSKAVNALPKDPRASFFCKIPLEYEQTSSLSSKSVAIQGELMPVSKKEVNSLKIAFSLTHPHSTNHVGQTADIYFAKLHPEQILYSTGDFGTTPTAVDITEYERAVPDILAQEIPTLLPRWNIAKQYELRLLCKHMLNIPDDVETVTLQTVDKLGIDIRTTQDDAREDYRLAFRHPVNSAEDAKSELIKLFQECYHKEHGQAGFVPVEPPVVVKYA